MVVKKVANRIKIISMKIEKTFRATLHVGLKIRDTGAVQNIGIAKRICQQFVDEAGECVSFTPTQYIYTNGGEKGVIIEFIQYPRFPRTEEEILQRALTLAEQLMYALHQFKVSVITPDKTYMLENDKLNSEQSPEECDASKAPDQH
jgi:hypothetical protein